VAVSESLSDKVCTINVELTDQNFGCSYETDLLPAVVHHINFSTDVIFTQQEFDYLTGLTPHQRIDSAALAQVMRYLAAKNKFSSIKVIISEVRDQGDAIRSDSDMPARAVNLFFEMTGLWSFDKVSFQGPLQSKEHYRSLYLLEAGEPFNKDKHEHSLKKIKQELEAQGFFEAHLEIYFDYNKLTKSVIVIIVIDPGKKFVIKETEITFSSDICAEDLREELATKVRSQFNDQLCGTFYSQENLENYILLLKKYLGRKGFADALVKIKKSLNYPEGSINIFVQIAVTKKRKFVFLGNHFFSKNYLLDSIGSFGNAVSFVPESLLQEELKHVYEAKGFFDTSILVKSNDEGSCFFIIDEGVRRAVGSIVICEATAFPTSVLESIFSASFKTGFIEEEALKDACSMLKQFYVKEGFWDIAIEYATLLRQPLLTKKAHKMHDIIITIKEGVCRHLASVDVRGSFPEYFHWPDALYKDVDKAFDPSLIGTQRQLLMNYFHERGYLYVQLRHELVTDENDSSRVHLIWQVSGSLEQVHFGKLIVRGSSSFPFANLMREMAFKEGDIWNQERLRESLSRLIGLTIFDSVYLYPHEVDKPEHSKIVIAKVIADDPFEIRLRFGFQQVSQTFLAFRKGTTYKLGGSFLYKNPTQSADVLCLEGDITRFYRNISGSYQRPWLAHYPVRTTLKGYTNKYIQPLFIGSDKSLYQATQQGFLVGLRRRWPFLDIGITLGNEWMETNHLSKELAYAINFEPALIDKKIPYVFIEPDIALNSLDNQLNPTRGLLTIFSAKLMIPWQRLQPSQGFLKLLFDQSLFFPFTDRVVLGFRFRFGHIFNKDFNHIMPPERFYLGGQNSIRSYEPDFGPPLGICIDEDGKKQLVPRGGRSVLAINFEARCIVWRALSIVLFQDLGTLIDPLGIHGSFGHLIAGSGFGLRYNTPIGPVRFDIGWKWKKYYPEESSYAWFLTLGHAF